MSMDHHGSLIDRTGRFVLEDADKSGRAVPWFIGSGRSTRAATFLLAALTVSDPVHGASPWVRVVGESASIKKSYEARDVRQTDDGGYVVAGSYRSSSIYDAWIARLSADGSTIWQKSYGLNKGIYGLLEIGAHSVSQMVDGAFLIAAFTNIFGSGEVQDSDLWLVRTDENGVVMWQRSYGGGSRDWLSGPASLAPTSDGGCVLAGTTESWSASSDAWVLRLDATGTILWQRTYGAEGDEGHVRIRATKEGGYVMAMSTYSFNDESWPQQGPKLWIVKLDSSGSVAWQRVYGGPLEDIDVNDIQQTSDGGYVVAAEADIFAEGDRALIMKLASTGKRTWERKMTDIGAKSLITISDEILLAGDFWTDGAPDIVLLQFNKTGKLRMQKSYGMAEEWDYGNLIRQGTDGTLMALGSSRGFTKYSAPVLFLLTADGSSCGSLSRAVNVTPKSYKSSTIPSKIIVTDTAAVPRPTSAKTFKAKSNNVLVCE